MLKDRVHESGSTRYEHSKDIVDWIKIDYEWAYWIDPESFNFKRVKRRAPVGAIVVVKSKKRLDDERTYVDSEFGLVIESGVTEITKREASEILAKQIVEYMISTKHWPPFASLKRVLKSGNAEVSYEPTEYDSFTLLLTRNMIGTEPSEYLKKLKKQKKLQEPPWRVETAKSGKSRCRSCQDVILEGRFRIGEPYFFEGSLSYRWYHPRCAASRIDSNELENLEGYDKLEPDEKQRLKRLLAQ